MNKYFDLFQKGEIVDTSSLDLSTLTFEERYWLLACKADEYMREDKRFESAVCMARIKELAFLNACAFQIDSCGFLSDKYLPYCNKFEHVPNDKKLLQIDGWVNGNAQREKRLNRIGMAVLVFSIAVIAILYFLTNMDFIPAMAIGVGISVLGNSIIIPGIYKRKLKNAQPEVLKGEAPEEIKAIIEFDAKLNDIVKEEDYLPLLRARNEQELNEAIRNYPKK